MARKIAGRLAAASLSLGFLSAPGLRAEDAPPLSAQCQAPAADIAAPAPLPNVAALLANRKKLRILAIGSSSTSGIGASSRSRN